MQSFEQNDRLLVKIAITNESRETAIHILGSQDGTMVMMLGN